MTKGMMDGTEELKGRKIFETVNEYLNLSGESSPGLLELSIYGLMEDALYRLRDLLKARKITWKEPFAQLEYILLYAGQKGLETEAAAFLREHDEFSTMHELTRHVHLYLGDPPIVCPPEPGDPYAKLVEGLSTDQLAAGYHCEHKIASVKYADEEVSIHLLFAISPMTFDPDRDGGTWFFRVNVGLDILPHLPAVWTEDIQSDVWKVIFKSLKDSSTPYLQELRDTGRQRLPIPKPDRAVPIPGGSFPVAAGFVPMHHLAKRNRGGLSLFPEASRTFHALRTPLNVATGLALFRFTSPDRPGDWQEVTINSLTDQVYCLTERDAPRRGDQAPDILGEVVKLFAETIAIVTPRFAKHGRIWKSRVELIFDRVIATLGLTYLDMKTGRRVRPDDPSLPRDAIVPLTVKGRRAYTPDGKDIKALLGDRWKLETIRWRWSPTIVDDLLASPVLDKKGKVIRDKSGKVIRGGFNIKVIIRIFDALFRLRSERAYIAHDLLVLLATDIYKPPKQSTAGRNIVEREADRLFDLLGLEDDPKHPERREEAVKGAIYRLKQPDIGALLAGSDEYPRTDQNPDRRKGLYYRLVRSALYTPPGILTKAEAAAIEAEYKAAPEPLALPDPKTKPDQVALPGIIEDKPLIPSGSDIRAAREAAGLNLRRFAELIGGPSFKTWSFYEIGKPIRVGSIKPDVWQRVRDFILQHGGK